MKSTFKYGDKVMAGYSSNHGRIVSIRKDGNEFLCTVKFDNPLLMPSEMEYKEKYLKLLVRSDNNCPLCGEEYKVVKFNMQVWKDCETCKDTSENLVKKDAKIKYDQMNESKKSKESDNTAKEAKLLKEFEKMLNDDDDDDDDAWDKNFSTFF